MKREHWIDFAKGIAILLVVVGHVNLGFLNANMFKNAHSFMKILYYAIYSFHMPLFFILSGYLYAKTWKTVSFSEYVHSICKKTVNFGVPYIVFSVVQWSAKKFMSNSVNNKLSVKDLLLMLVVPIDQMWFLYALIGVFITVGFFDTIIKNDMIVFFMIVLLTVTGHFIHIIPMIHYITAYSIYFYIGKLMNRKLLLIENKWIFFANVAGFIFLDFIGYRYSIKFPILILLEAVSGSFIVFYITKKIKSNRVVEYLGILSFPIYLLSILFGSGIRIVLTKLHVYNMIVHYVFGIGVGVIGPILVYRAMSRVRALNFLFYPLKSVGRHCTK